MEAIVGLIALLLLFNFSQVSAENNSESSNDTYLELYNDGQTFYVSDIQTEYHPEKIQHKHYWVWIPWLATRYKAEEEYAFRNIDPGLNSVDSFPDSIFSDDQLRKGGFMLYVLFGIYSFTLLAIVCNDYFIPCVELICEDLKIPQNIAAATFMSVATSCPEFFVNTISTFLIESDMGIGTIMGSAIFNALGVGAIGGLAAISPIAIDKRPVIRDILIYMVNVLVLVATVWDGKVDWYEALSFGVLYVFYFILMFNSMRLFALFDRVVGKKNGSSDSISEVVTEGHCQSKEGFENKGFDEINEVLKSNYVIDKTSLSDEKGNSMSERISLPDENDEPDKSKAIWNFFKFPREKSLINKIWWIYSFPLKVILGSTIPSTVLFRRFYPLAFVMCIVWIGVNSYFVTWSMSVIGYAFFIPESVMGMTFLAFGGCLPEACSIFIMSRRGEGGIGVSNALGANSLAILFALGLPWLIRTLTLVAQGAEQTSVLINSDDIDFVVGSLFVAVTCLWIVLYFGKFILKKSVGAILLVLYAIFITFAVLIETDVIFKDSII